MGKRNCPRLFSGGLATSQDDNLTESLKKDLVWSTSDSFRRKNNNDVFQDLGSWTNYQKLVTDYPTRQCVQDYLTIVPSQPERILGITN